MSRDNEMGVGRRKNLLLNFFKNKSEEEGKIKQLHSDKSSWETAVRLTSFFPDPEVPSSKLAPEESEP